MVRVLLAHNRYRLAGGEERHLDLIERGLGEAGVAVRRFEKSSLDVGDALSRRLAVGLGMTYRPSSARAIRVLLRDWRPDVVHVHNLLPLLTPSILREAKRHGSAVVLTVHNYRLFCPSGTLVRGREIHDDCIEGSSLACGLRKPRDSWSESIAYGLALELQRRLRLVERWVDSYVSPSVFVARMLARAGFPSERIRVIRNGVPLSSWKPKEREFALYAGRLANEKGLRTLLEASKRAPEVPLLIAGDGPLRAEVEAVNGAIKYIGLLAPGRLAQVRARAAFVVVPSEYPDPLPFAAVEAVADGTPVITSNLGGLPEIATSEAGVAVPAGDPDALAAAMRQLWQKSQSDEDFGRSAWESARKRFSLDAQISELVNLYGDQTRRTRLHR